MRFWEIADARNPMFFHTKSVPEPRWSTSAVRRVRDGLVCGRIMGGSCSDRFRIVNGASTVFRACAVDRIPVWFATVGSFPQCKWDCKWCWWMSCRWNSIVICNCRIVPAMQIWHCKWCWWMSCRWSFEGSPARNAFLREQMHETLCFSIQSPSPNLDDLPLRCDGCETVSCVVGSWADHVRIGSAL